LAYLRRNIASIDEILDLCESIPFDQYQYKYWFVIQHLYEQQKIMYANKTHSIENRIVSIHQPHVRPIVRGKSNAKVEFGLAKTAYGLDRIKARLANTSASWVASIILVLNSVNLAELVRYFLKIILLKLCVFEEKLFYKSKYDNLNQNSA
jgi:regulator of extracellular matrix RemA (YlzA/DUF370 family)